MEIRAPPTSLRLAKPPASASFRPAALRTSFVTGRVSLRAVQVRQSNVNRFKCNAIRSNLFDRLTRVVRSYANAILSSFEDPEKILDQAVLEMNDDLTKMRQATAQVLASQKRLENKYKAAEQADADWYRRAQLALQKGEEDLAREALKRRKSYADNASSLRAQLDQQKSVVDNLVSNTRGGGRAVRVDQVPRPAAQAEEACKGEERLHIVDFDINQGSQYITLMQFMKNDANKPRHLRITGVDDHETVQRTIGGLKVIGQRLEKLAEDCGISFEFRAVGANIGDVTPAMLDCRPGEALVVNFAFQLHHLPDESVSIMNERDQLLRMVKGLEPKLVTLVEQDANTNTAPFQTRFREVYDYYSALFDSLDATLPRESPDRMNVERQCLAREIVNILACEGPDRVERYEVAGKWRARMTMAGFAPCPFSSNVIGGIRSLLSSYCNSYKFEEDHGGLHFGWGEKTLIVSSAWQ